ncbi:YebC/PmpR family DNA-binding transcriptional regulator, partial [Sedimenticola sp.]
MAGHSKWANIKHKKAANDKKRGKIWTKLLREVTVAAKAGGGEIETNPRLRLAVDKANGANVPRDTIERAVKRGAGGEDTDNYDELRYEGYGPGGAAVIVDCMTDNRNRTASEVRHAFTKHGGNLGTDGSVAYMFNKQGIISFAPGADEDAIMEAALEAGAEDVVTNDDGSIDIMTTPEAFSDV